MARKAKKRLPKMPPLSFVDKLIYWTIFLLLLATWAGLCFGTFYLRSKIAFADSTVVATEDHASLLWLLVPWITWFLMSFILWLQPYQARQPIFGLRNFKYGPPAWPRVYPLFMRNKPQEWVSERKKKKNRLVANFLLVVLLVSFLPYPLSLYGRDCLHSNGTIVEYNMFNGESETFSVGDIAELKIEVSRHYRRKSFVARYSVIMTFQTKSGEEYCFEAWDFRSTESGEIPNWPATMLQIKRQFPSHIIRYDGSENLHFVISRLNLSPEAIEKLRELFDQTP